MQNVKAIILVGSRDFGRCPLSSSLPTAMWPVAGKPVLERLLIHLADQGIKQAVVCGSCVSSLPAEKILADDRLELSFLDESLPAGTAGCIREAVSDGTEALLMVFPASIVCPPEIDVLIKAHRDGQSDLTVMLNPCDADNTNIGQASGIYVCDPCILEHIPKAGYFDIKEGLIPKMLLAGRSIHAAKLSSHAGNFRNRQEYLCAVSNYLEKVPKLNEDMKPLKNSNSQDIWLADNARVDPEARINGPVIIMDSATVSSGALVLGPTIIGANAAVGQDSVVINSVVWDGVKVGSNCRIRRCVVGYHATVRDNAVLDEKSILFKPERMLERVVNLASTIAKNNSIRLRRALKPLGKISEKLPNWTYSSRKNTLAFLASGLVLIAFIWSYRPGLVELWSLLLRSDEYSAGLFVPFLCVYILWSRRQDIAQSPIRPSIWGLFAGLFAFIMAQVVRLMGLFLMYNSAERLSIILSIAALVLLLFGWQLFRKVSTILLFLCLMLPWPNIMQYFIGLRLQSWATSSAVFCLEIIGYGVLREGNIIHIGDVSVAVVEACNGLRMITAFFVITGLVVLLVKRAWWEKLIILVSSLPIALLCNTVRLVITALFFTVLEGEYWEKIFHDFGGYAMMPLALAAVVGELWLLAKLTVLPVEEKAIIITRQRG